MKSKKITTFFILAAMLAGVVSCGSGNGDVVTTGGESTDTTTAGETEIHDDLPELNFGGISSRSLSRTTAATAERTSGSRNLTATLSTTQSTTRTA